MTIARPQDAAQRRQVTVMFSDLVGSTALSARMDPEDLREVISVYQRCVAETIQCFGGVVVSAPWSEAVPAPLLIYKTNPNALITRPPARQVISRPKI